VDLEAYKRRVFFTIKKYRLVEMGDIISGISKLCRKRRATTSSSLR